MAEHTYKPGDHVARHFVIAGHVSEEAARLAGGRDWALMDTEGRVAPWAFMRDIAPWLSRGDQDSLLRVVKAAMDTHRWRTARGETPSTELAWSLNALSPEVLERVARLSEGE